MATINDGELNLFVEGAPYEGLCRGLLAARASLGASGFSLEECFRGHFEREGADMKGTRLLAHHRKSASALDDAHKAAVRACFPERDWLSVPAGLSMQEVFQRSEQDIEARRIRHLNPDRGPHYLMRTQLLAAE